MYPIKQATIVLAVASAVALPAACFANKPAAASPPEHKASSPVPVDASIGRISSLARQVKVAQLEKDLREAKAAAAPIALQGSTPTPIPAIGGFGATLGTSRAAPAPKEADRQPGIQSITSVGGQASAISTEGRPMVVGSLVVIGDANWRVTAIQAHGVGFEKCVKKKCSNVTVAVGR